MIYVCRTRCGNLALLADNDRVSVCLLGSRMLEDVKLLIMPLGYTVVNSLTGLVKKDLNELKLGRINN